MLVRGVRGATTVSENTKEEIVSSTAELLEKMILENEIDSENIASIIFTTTSDVYNEFPAVAAREILSLHSVPLLNMQEINNPNGLSGADIAEQVIAKGRITTEHDISPAIVAFNERFKIKTGKDLIMKSPYRFNREDFIINTQ